MPSVTIARQLGSGGEEIARAVAARLGSRLLDHDLLVRAGERAGIPVEFLEEVDERGRGVLRRPADLVRLVPMPPINPDLPDVTGDRYPPTGPVLARGDGLVSPAYWAAEAYASLLARTMQAEAAAGDAVIVGRAGNEALGAIPNVLHVLVIAGMRTRLERVAASEAVNAFDARDLILESDKRRAAYARQFYNADWLEPARYDLIVNTDKLSVEAAAGLIVSAAQQLGTAPTAMATGAVAAVPA